MRKPKYPGQLLEKAAAASKMKPAKKAKKSKPAKKAKMSMKKFEGSPMDNAIDKAVSAHMPSKHMKKSAKKMKKGAMKPKGARGLAQVKKLGRTMKTGGFAKIAKAASKRYGSKEAGKRVAGKVFQAMVKARAAKKGKMVAKKPAKMAKAKSMTSAC